MQRWPKLSLRKADALAQPNANAVTTEKVNKLLKKTLEDKDLMNCANRIYNYG